MWLIGVYRGLYERPPAALFLVPARNRGKNRAKGVPPLRFSHARDKQYKIGRSTGSFSADGLLPARSPPLPIYMPFRSHARGADAGATVGTPCRSCPKRGGDQPTAAHEVKRRPQIVCRAPDGAGSIATRAGFLRAEPLGVSFVQPFLHEQKRAGRRRQKLLYKLWFIQSAQHFLPANAIQNLAINDVLC